MSDPQQTPPGPNDDRNWREGRWRERHEYRNRPGGFGGPWIGGLVLIVVGAIFMARNMGVEFPDNWWAFFMLIPAIGSLAAAWSGYRRNGGRIDGGVLGALVAALIFVVLMVALLLGFDWGQFWPAIIILIGLAMLARAYWRP